LAKLANALWAHKKLGTFTAQEIVERLRQKLSRGELSKKRLKAGVKDALGV
jgi:hypothetical protein